MDSSFSDRWLGRGTAFPACSGAIFARLELPVPVKTGTDAKAISYVKLSIGDDTAWGVGEDTDTAKANFDAVLSAVTRVPGALDRLAGRDSGAHD